MFGGLGGKHWQGVIVVPPTLLYVREGCRCYENVRREYTSSPLHTARLPERLPTISATVITIKQQQLRQEQGKHLLTLTQVNWNHVVKF